MPLGRAGSHPMEICQSEAVSFLLEVMESNTAKNTKILAIPTQTENGMRFLLSLGGYSVVFLQHAKLYSPKFHPSANGEISPKYFSVLGSFFLPCSHLYHRLKIPLTSW